MAVLPVDCETAWCVLRSEDGSAQQPDLLRGRELTPVERRGVALRAALCLMQHRHGAVISKNKNNTLQILEYFILNTNFNSVTVDAFVNYTF